jgi:hypothetical protein
VADPGDPPVTTRVTLPYPAGIASAEGTVKMLVLLDVRVAVSGAFDGVERSNSIV